MQRFGEERVEVPAPFGSCAVAVDDDDLFRARRFSASDGGVHLFGVEPPALFIQLRSAERLLPCDNAADAFHVAHDENAHLFLHLFMEPC